ncbi:cytochrome c-type biogenesis protein [Aestuariivirga sp. YIM B02566]|uniref:Cytochrome c-type biogenesis protein CcmH n=1 Tax=Taklimakanibacter albus TaxID=2800327 RepID=A0ACC5RBH7_9HYPH|nr:cytochrome c-type biogenesis protein [Aestuariivirga sp. YIM B02566]MBK1869973.1 cytochrome c-type biogenesis protein CcmH [Aestuariivirga sp. YIM B02566]
MKRLGAIVLLLSLWIIPAQAVQPDEILSDPVLEARARDLSTGLRCLVCQNQSIDDSNAPLARDLRLLLRDRLKAGDSDAQAVDFIVARYGDYVLLRPRFNAATWLLWIGPFALLAAAGAFLFMRRRNKLIDAESALDPQEQAELDRLMDRRP